MCRRQVQFWAPQASGAGVSLIMAYLNGNAIPDLLSLRALVAKFSGGPPLQQAAPVPEQMLTVRLVGGIKGSETVYLGVRCLLDASLRLVCLLFGLIILLTAESAPLQAHTYKNKIGVEKAKNNCLRDMGALDKRRTCLRMLPHNADQGDAAHNAPGTLCGVTANVALGPEAPMVHLGGCVAHVVTHAACSARPAAVRRPARSLRRMPGVS